MVCLGWRCAARWRAGACALDNSELQRSLQLACASSTRITPAIAAARLAISLTSN